MDSGLAFPRQHTSGNVAVNSDEPHGLSRPCVQSWQRVYPELIKHQIPSGTTKLWFLSNLQDVNGIKAVMKSEGHLCGLWHGRRVLY